MRRKRRTEAGAVKLNFEALVDQPFLEVSVQSPPDRLDVVVLARDVWMVHVDPIPHAPRELFPHIFVFENGLAAFGIEFGDTILLDLSLVLEAELFLDFYFNRKSVRVPSRLTVHLKSTHRPVAAN